jgi:hypothetical protein
MIEQHVNKKIKKYFSNKELSFNDFESVKNYMKNNPSWKDRGDGSYSIQYHCRFPGCTKVSIGNVSDAASCFLNHYKSDFFSCPCGNTYKIIVSLRAHARNCDSLTNQSSDETDSDKISDSDEWEIANSEIAQHHDELDEDLCDFDLGMLNEGNRMDTSLFCTETLEPTGVDPKLIFTLAQSLNN